MKSDGERAGGAGEPSAGRGLLVTGDLIFSTKIASTAQALGLTLSVVGSGAAAVASLDAAPARCTILDLGLTSLTAEQIREVVAAAQGQPVIAFGSHVDTQRLASARAAGCREVLPRSRLAGNLPAILEQYLGA